MRPKNLCNATALGTLKSQKITVFNDKKVSVAGRYTQSSCSGQCIKFKDFLKTKRQLLWSCFCKLWRVDKIKGLFNEVFICFLGKKQAIS